MGFFPWSFFPTTSETGDEYTSKPTIPDVPIPPKTFKIETVEDGYGKRSYNLYSKEHAIALHGKSSLSYCTTKLDWYFVSGCNTREEALAVAQRTYNYHIDLKKKYTSTKVKTEYIS